MQGTWNFIENQKQIHGALKFLKILTLHNFTVSIFCVLGSRDIAKIRHQVAKVWRPINKIITVQFYVLHLLKQTENTNSPSVNLFQLHESKNVCKSR